MSKFIVNISKGRYENFKEEFNSKAAVKEFLESVYYNEDGDENQCEIIVSEVISYSHENTNLFGRT